MDPDQAFLPTCFVIFSFQFLGTMYNKDQIRGNYKRTLAEVKEGGETATTQLLKKYNLTGGGPRPDDPGGKISILLCYNEGTYLQ